ncbi:hypothetical protein F2P81_007229 [Scophthalmus maximus]|uniref:Uncharacterized protein n=1 Tax=Scophthalmus maximus TaxID=52904 RepID=A0A6A4TER7_SCOMX|nr:hypothetical protein F2P81_007229 [Scophthalmus maximus]
MSDTEALGLGSEDATGSIVRGNETRSPEKTHTNSSSSSSRDKPCGIRLDSLSLSLSIYRVRPPEDVRARMLRFPVKKIRKQFKLLLLLVLLTSAVWFTYLHINQGKTIRLHFNYGKDLPNKVTFGTSMKTACPRIRRKILQNTLPE